MATVATSQLFRFFASTFAVTWTCWAAAWLLADAAAPGRVLSAILFYAGVFAPGGVALALSARAGGAASALALLRRLVDWRVAGRWYLFALSYMAVIKLVAAVLHRAVAGTWPSFGTVPLALLFGGAILSTVTGGQAGEELGWRGYALPRLAEWFGIGGGSIVLGVIWAVWHLPVFYILGGDTVGHSFTFYALQVTGISVALGWLYWRTSGSLLPVMLMHAAVNNTKDIVPTAPPGVTNPFVISSSLMGWLSLALIWACAAFLLIRMRGARLPSPLGADGGSIRGIEPGPGPSLAT